MKLRPMLSQTLALCLLLGASIVMAQVAFFVVTPGDPQGWFERGSNTGTIGLGVADSHGGTSSLLLSTDGSDGQIVKVARVPIPVIRVSGVASVSWDLNTDNITNYPRPNIEYWSPALAGTLVYEISNFTPTANTWQNVVMSGSSMFRDTNTNVVDTLANFQAGPIGNVPVNFFQLGFGSTSGAVPAVNGNIDYVELNGTTWDFEEVAILPPEPVVPTQQGIPTLSQWALILLAMLMGLVAFVSLRRRAQ